jgi:hypothetical protein
MVTVMPKWNSVNFLADAVVKPGGVSVKNEELHSEEWYAAGMGNTICGKRPKYKVDRTYKMFLEQRLYPEVRVQFTLPDGFVIKRRWL